MAQNLNSLVQTVFFASGFKHQVYWKLFKTIWQRVITCVYTKNESLQNIKGLTERHPGLRLLVRVDPYDAPVVDTEKLVSAIKIVGAHKVLAQVSWTR